MTDTAYLDTSIEEAELLAIDAELRLSSSDDPATLLAEVADCDALLVNFATVGADVINALSRCKIIVSAAIGVDNIDVEAATRRGIMVANVPDYCIQEVADHTVSLFLASIRKVVYLADRVKTGFWQINDAKPIPRLRGKVYGLLGCGSIGREVAKRVAAFGMEVVGYDPYVPNDVLAQANIRRIENLDDFFRSWMPFLHAPLTDETYHVINCETLRR